MPNFVAPMIGRGVALKAPTADGTNGQVLTTNGAGQLSFATAGGGGVDLAANYAWTGAHTHAQAITVDADVNGDSEKIKLVNEFNASGVSSSVAGYHWNGSAQYKSARLKFRRWSASANFGDFAIDIGSNNSWSEKLTLDVNGILTVPTVVATATMSAGQTGNPTGLHYSAGGTTPGVSVIRHGIWAKDNLDLRLRASGSDWLNLSWDGRLTLGDATTERTESTGKLAVVNQSTTTIAIQAVAAASQTADLIQCQDSVGAEVFAIEADGSIDQAAGAKLGFLGATPVTQRTAGGVTAGFVAATGSAVLSGSTFTGNVGATAYTISDIVAALKLYGLLNS